MIIHMCTGSLVNDTLGRYLAAMIAAHEGRAINVKTDPYRIILETGESPEHVKKLLESADRIEDVLRLALENSQLFKNRFLHVARRFGIISKTAEMDRINLGKIISHYHGSPAYNETMREILLEKMDIGESEKTIEKIRTNEIRITIQPGLSYLGELGLTPRHIDVLKPGMPEEEILKAFKNRILNTYVRLACLNCGAHLEIKQAKDIDDQPECSSCGSILISCLHRNQRDISRIIKKKISKKPLNEEEKHIYKEAQRSADMIIAYGKRTCICLAGRGIGPETASRILSMLYDTDDKLFRAILEAEKTFARTKIYWK
ncbi:MAG: hypothetical protein HZB65_01755 [Candidatus Aenigmarchaeota archaeon]|nr:hypothetical protein [Candidatus Aenigmarchaeota archaeon]